MSNILAILNQVGADAGRNYKLDVMARNASNDTLKHVCFLALDPFTQNFIRKIPAYTPSTRADAESLEWALKQLSKLSSREVTGHAGIAHLKKVLESVTAEDGDVIERVISKDLKCGISEGTVNKTWPNLVPTFDVCLAHKDVSGIKFPAYAQIKMDGGRCHLRFDGQNATAYSRNGKVIEFLGALDSSASALMKTGEIWDGEVVFFRNGKALDRKTSNGLFNKGVKGTISKDEAVMAKFIAWDIVDFSSTIPYNVRFDDLCSRFTKNTTQLSIKLIDSRIVSSMEAASEFYDSCIANGEEGAILKNMKFCWEPKRVKGVGKMKAVEEADLLVVGWELGTGKHSNRMGALVCETRDGLLRVNVGTGFSDEDRADGKSYVGKVITVPYNQLIKDKKKDTMSLFLPRFGVVRLDKNQANSLSELK